MGRKFTPDDIGYLDPSLKITSNQLAGPIYQVGSKTYYRDVKYFLEAAALAADRLGAKVVRHWLHTCLRGTA